MTAPRESSPPRKVLKADGNSFLSTGRCLMPELSLKEKDRRYGLLRRVLKKAGLSALMVYGGTQLGVPVHYLTRVWGNKQNMVVFPVVGEPVFLIPGTSGMRGGQLV